MARFNKTRKTVENTLPNLKRGKTPKVVTAGRGRVSLSPAEIQKRQQAEGPTFIPNRSLSKTGGKVEENRSPQGKSSGETQIPLPDSVLTHYPPLLERRHPNELSNQCCLVMMTPIGVHDQIPDLD